MVPRRQDLSSEFVSRPVSCVAAPCPSRCKIMVRNIGVPLNRNSLKGQLMRGGAGSVGLNVANVSLGLAVAVVLARVLGPKNYGIYTYVYALVSLLAVPAQFGLPTLVVRETAKAEVKQEWGLMRGLWRWAGSVAAALALMLAVVAGVFAWYFSGHFSALQLKTFVWGLALIPLIALGTLRGAALQGLRSVVQGQLPEQVVRPALLILMVLVIGFFAGGKIKADEAMALHALAAGCGFAIGAWLLWREQPSQVAARPPPVYELRRWLASTLPLALLAGTQVITNQTDVVMLGIFASAQDVGVYRVAAQGATLVSLAFAALGIAAMPHLARLYTKGDMCRFQRLATVSAGAALLVALPILLAFLLFGDTILGTVFGARYVNGGKVLSILASAYFVNVGFGMVGRLLNMAGYEHDTAKGVGVAAVCNVVLNVILIPLYGMTGAAAATAISMLVWNIVLWRMVRRRLGVDSSIFGLLPHRYAGQRCGAGTS